MQLQHCVCLCVFAAGGRASDINNSKRIKHFMILIILGNDKGNRATHRNRKIFYHMSMFDCIFHLVRSTDAKMRNANIKIKQFRRQIHWGVDITLCAFEIKRNAESLQKKRQQTDEDEVKTIFRKLNLLLLRMTPRTAQK